MIGEIGITYSTRVDDADLPEVDGHDALTAVRHRDATDVAITAVGIFLNDPGRAVEMPPSGKLNSPPTYRDRGREVEYQVKVGPVGDGE